MLSRICLFVYYIYIKDFLKFLLIYNIAIIIPFGYPAYNIITFLLINIYLAKDLFRKPKIDFKVWKDLLI